MEMGLLYLNLAPPNQIYNSSESTNMLLYSTNPVQTDTSIEFTNRISDLNITSSVNSVVDWSEFYVSELKDIVLAKIESLKQYYKEKNDLFVIEEDS